MWGKKTQSFRVHVLYGYGNARVSNISFEFSKQLSPSVKGGCFPAEKSAAYTSAECGDLTLVRVLSRCRLAPPAKAPLSMQIGCPPA